MSIPAIAPPGGGGSDAPSVLPPGFRASRLSGAIDDSFGSGVIVPLNSVDDHFVDWRMQSIDGWDSPPLGENSEDRSGADGAWDGLNYYGGRIITIGGLLTSPSYAEREAAEYRLRQVVPPRRLVRIRIDETTPKYVMGRRSGRLMIAPVDDVHSKWSAAFFCPSARKYGTALRSVDLSLPELGTGLAPPWTPPVLIPSRSTSESATVVNLGDYETPMLITLYGPGRDPGIVNLTTGQIITFLGPLASGHSITVDTEAGTALLDGTAPRSPAPGSALIAEVLLVPGENRLQLLGTRTDPIIPTTATVTWSDAWT